MNPDLSPTQPREEEVKHRPQEHNANLNPSSAFSSSVPSDVSALYVNDSSDISGIMAMALTAIRNFNPTFFSGIPTFSPDNTIPVSQPTPTENDKYLTTPFASHPSHHNDLITKIGELEAALMEK